MVAMGNSSHMKWYRWEVVSTESGIYPVNISNRGNVDLSWDGWRLVVGESMKGWKDYDRFFMQNTSLIDVDLFSPRHPSVSLSSPRGEKW